MLTMLASRVVPPQKKLSRKKLEFKYINAVLFILKTKYFVCRQHFNKMLKPLDVKDVMDQYSSGQVEMLARVKHILNKVVGIETTSQSTVRAQLETGNLLNYRLVKLEEFMEVTEDKLDQLIRIQLENKILNENILSALGNYKNNQNQESESRITVYNKVLTHL